MHLTSCGILKHSRISGIIDFGGSGLGDPAYDFAGILSSYGREFFDMCMNLYPNGDEISERVKFYKSTFALQEALHGIENGDRQAFESGIQDYR
ncbi:phosphotransferase [Heyndrickxia sp. FSL W8-0496]|uniref:phosphotransferase n=1 Tax=Heyndrickxia TaxID=2837504 RepID=UPI0030FB8C72